MRCKMSAVADRAATLQKKLKYSNTKICHLKQSTCDIITDLKKKEMISTNCEEMLQHASSAVLLKWILR